MDIMQNADIKITEENLAPCKHTRDNEDNILAKQDIESTHPH
ncbi:2004_t:CDS:2 [Scutellospora calospora]|uniref:2004_t:CDS:1 n=1 Tax=Scutellospora calospora TaxID=85575 RepID=A0ACA9L9I6_9GLOM|nr:2004_t:CDS:2 [Scutellospora calospora]